MNIQSDVAAHAQEEADYILGRTLQGSEVEV